MLHDMKKEYYLHGDKFDQNEKMLIKVSNHCHYTGNYWGPAHSSCNLRYMENNYMSITAPNLLGYDDSLILVKIGKIAIFYLKGKHWKINILFIKERIWKIKSKPAHDVPRTSHEGPLKILTSGIYRGPSMSSKGTNTKIDYLIKKLFFRSDNPCVIYLFLFFTGRVNIQNFGDV